MLKTKKYHSHICPCTVTLSYSVDSNIFSLYMTELKVLKLFLSKFVQFHAKLFSIFHFFNQAWHKVSLHEGIQVCWNERPIYVPLQGEIIEKMGWDVKKLQEQFCQKN